MNAVLGLTEFVCDFDEHIWALKADFLVRNAVLRLTDFVCDLGELGWALKAEL